MRRRERERGREENKKEKGRKLTKKKYPAFNKILILNCARK